MDEKYIFSSTYLRVIEKWLLDVTDIQRMIGAKDAKEALKVLGDTNYAKEFRGIISKIKPEDYQKILDDDLKSAKRLIFFLTKDKNLIKFLLSFFDFYNLKLFFKEKIFQQNLEEFAFKEGFQNPKELKKAVFGERNAEIDEDFQKIIEKANSVLKDKRDPFFIENYFDRERIYFLVSLAKRLKNKWIQEYLQLKIDLLNLINIARMYRLGKKEKIKEILIEGGKIKWENSLFERCQNFKELILTKKRDFEEKVYSILQEYLENEDLKKFAKKLENLENEYLKTSRYILAGPEIFVAYFTARENANKNVKIIIEGKLNGIKNEEIQEMVITPI